MRRGTAWLSRRSLLILAALGVGVLLAGGGGVAAACKFALDCNLRPDESLELGYVEGQIVLPEGFTSQAVASGLVQPVAFDFLSDGRILVAERAGLVRVAEAGRVARRPVLDLRERVSTELFRGLVALTVDPEFDRNGFFYVVYSVRRPGAAPEDPTVVRVSRFVLEGNSAGAERVLLGSDGDETDSCMTLPATADCLPAEVDHIGADIVFAEDGTMFVATGDGGGLEEVEETAFRALDVDSLAGKILRITRDGQGLADNPFFDGDLSANRSKVWATGLRNPFRMTLTSAGLPVVADVGWEAADEIDVAPAAANLGWPCFEGHERTKEYSETARCEDLYTREEPRMPVLALPQPESISTTGGVIYEGDAYPERYRGAYFYADWARSWVRHVRIDSESGMLAGDPGDFAENAGGPVAFRIGPDGLMYILSLNYGEIRRISY